MVDGFEDPMSTFYSDDVRMIHDLLKDHWDLGVGNEVNIEYKPEMYMTSARVGFIYVYQVGRPRRIASVDYATSNVESHVSIRVSNRFRENHFLWCGEVDRILNDYRRAGPRHLGGYTYLEITSDRPNNDLSGWYTTTFEVKLVRNHKPYRSAGFGEEVNKLIEGCCEHGECDRHSID